MAYPYIIQGNNVSVVIGSKSYTISKTHITYQKIVDAIKSADWDAVKELVDPTKVVLNYGKGNVSVQGDVLYWKGEALNTGLAIRMIQMLQEGFPIEPMVNFMENLYKNPSKRSVNELYGFLEKNNLPITPDGHFLAYKKVRGNYFDCHSGTMDNSVGKVVEMERNAVDDDRDRTCSTGLHFCGMSYLAHFGGERIMIVKINPADVVSIPSDYNDAKGRTCRYEVIGELNAEPEQAFTESVQSNGHGIVEPVVENEFWFEDIFEEEDEEDDQDVVDKADATPQDYDSRGRPLSMTPDAIRKRRQRAAARAAGTGASWPLPKKP